jgi:hypothetical protein
LLIFDRWQLREECLGPWQLHASTRQAPVNLSDSRSETHLAVAVCAVLAGARSVAAIGEWAADVRPASAWPGSKPAATR